MSASGYTSTPTCWSISATAHHVEHSLKAFLLGHRSEVDELCDLIGQDIDHVPECDVYKSTSRWNANSSYKDAMVMTTSSTSMSRRAMIQKSRGLKEQKA